ncbi:MAG: SpoIIIAH-like family protein [Bacillota bacterium]|nr:SpoIIIAH-like family protein [Bacillota bacterium]
MKGKKSFCCFIKRNRKKAAALAMLIICFGVYTAIGGISPDIAVNDDIPLHDGDVLVDSLNVGSDSNESDKSTGNTDESELVTSDDVSELENNDAYFQELRATLDMDRNKIISMLTEAEGSAGTEAEKKEASAEKMRLLDYMEQEKTIETLIKNKGLAECFVVITDSGINITVNSEELDQQTVAKITEITMRETDRNADEIVIQKVR